WANWQFYGQLLADAQRTERWRDKLRIWFMPTGWRPADVAAKYPINKPDLSRFVKFEVPLARRQQVYIAAQFAVYLALGSYLLNLGETLSPQALMLGWGYMALGLFVLGAGLENRPWALKLEWLRLALNLPLVWLAPVAGLWPASALGWVGLSSYTLLSVMGLYVCRNRITRLAGC
ncbi:MAG: hypothetical protein J6D44_02540, partial [Pseudomonas sp.]|nr:hypothetical protein [Pseudomonas sp.]